MRSKASLRIHPKTRGFYYRRAVPSRLRDLIGLIEGFDDGPRPDTADRIELVKSLGTKDSKHARQLARHYNSRVDEAFRKAEERHAARSAPPEPAVHPLITPDQATAAIASWQAMETHRATIRAFNSPPDYLKGRDSAGLLLLSRIAETGEGWQEVQNFDLKLASNLSHQGLRITAGHPSVPRLRQAFAAAWLSCLLHEARQVDQPLSFSPRKLPTVPTTASTVPVTVPVTVDTPEPGVPFLTYESEWIKQTGQASRQAAMYLSDLRQYAAAHPGLTLDGVTKVAVQKWLESFGGSVRNATLLRKLAAVRNYWGWLQAHGHAPEAEKPFHLLRMPRENAVEQAETARKAFHPQDVRRLWEAAAKDRQPLLAEVIRLLAYTGCRVEEICQLRASDICLDRATDVRVIHFGASGSKSAAGVRDTPIHSEIAGLIDRLLEKKQPSDYLVYSPSANKHGRRSAHYSVQFTKLKKQLDFSSHYVMHSIRKTFATLRKEGGHDESIAAEIIGHEHTGMTYGRYGSKSSPKRLLEIIETSIRFPEPK